MIIYASHGIIGSIDPHCLAHRNLISSKSLLDFAIKHQNAIVDIDKALRNEAGIVLTIDDNTKASYDAAKLLSERGIPVVWFINPANLLSDTTYSFAELNALLDSVKNGVVEYGNGKYNMEDYHQKKRLRKNIKEYMHRHLKSEHERIRYIKQLAQEIGCEIYKIPPEAETISLSQVLSLNMDFVTIMNHLWEHNFTDVEEYDSLKKNIVQGKEWLEKTFSKTVDHHALPYGLYSPTVQNMLEDEFYYLLDNRYPEGKIGKNIINRKTLVLP